jgi:hypothetical protein
MTERAGRAGRAITWVVRCVVAVAVMWGIASFLRPTPLPVPDVPDHVWIRESDTPSARTVPLESPHGAALDEGFAYDRSYIAESDVIVQRRKVQLDPIDELRYRCYGWDLPSGQIVAVYHRTGLADRPSVNGGVVERAASGEVVTVEGATRYDLDVAATRESTSHHSCPEWLWFNLPRIVRKLVP